MHSRHLTGHAVDLAALDGEVSWQWEDYFRVAATMQAAVCELEVPLCWGGCWDSLLAIASPEDSVADYVATAGQPARSRCWTARISSCRGPAGMIDWIQTVQGLAAIVAAIFATKVAWWNLGLPRLVFSPELALTHRRIEALEQVQPRHRLLVLDEGRVERQSARGRVLEHQSPTSALRQPSDRHRERPTSETC